MFKKVTTPSTTKNKKQESISDLVMIINRRNDSVNNNTDHEVKDDNVQNTIYNRRIDHATTTKVVDNIFSTKYTLDTRQEEQNSAISSSKVRRNIFEAIKQMDGTTIIITQDNIRITNINTFPTDKEHNISFPDQRI